MSHSFEPGGSWDEYAAWHTKVASEIRQGRVDANCLVYSIDRQQNGAKLPVGGFADRIKGLALLVACAVATKRAFFIDWSLPSPLTNTFRPREIDWRVPSILLERRDEGPVVDWISDRFTAHDAAVLEHGRLEEELFKRERIVMVHCNRDHYWHLAKGPYAALLAAAGMEARNQTAFLSIIFQRLFEFSPTGNVAEKFAAFLRFKSQHSAVVAVQFRTGGDGAWADVLMDNQANVERIVDAALLQASALEKQVGFFVTTDSLVARDKLVSRLSRHGSVFSFEEEPVHVDESPAEHGTQMFDFVAAEFRALSLCDVVVHGQGGFGFVAAWAGGRPAVHYNTLTKEPRSAIAMLSKSLGAVSALFRK